MYHEEFTSLFQMECTNFIDTGQETLILSIE